MIIFIYLTEKKKGALEEYSLISCSIKISQKAYVLLEEVSKCYIETYVELVNINKKHKFTAEDREFQLYRRGRYVEFNLLFDRGTKFGIESNGRTDSILASMPPAVNWPFRLSANINKKEKKLLKFIDKKWNEHN